MLRYFFVGIYVLLLLPAPAAQFGVANKRQKQLQQQQQASPSAGATAGVELESGDAIGDLLNDPELREAVEMLSDMSPDEMEETMRELSAMLGDDDPETAAALQEAIREVSKMSPGEMRASLDRIVAAESQDKDVADAVTDTLRMLKEADGTVFDTILEKKDLILEAVVQSGQISEEDAERYRKNPAEWENELKGIWGELRRQADESL